MALTLRSITEEAPPSPAQDLEKQLALAANFTRKHVIASIYHAGSGHPGGALSCADLCLPVRGGIEFLAKRGRPTSRPL